VGAEALLFGFLYWLFGRAHRPGTIIALYMILSSVLRFGIEFTRFHEQALPFGLPFSITQWIAVGLALAGAAILWSQKSRSPKAIPSLAH
jgi:prolipoprotein diacylglyceryltransferase